MKKNMLFDNTELGVMDFTPEDIQVYKSGFSLDHTVNNQNSIVLPTVTNVAIEAIRPKGLLLKVIRKVLLIHTDEKKQIGGIYKNNTSPDLFFWYRGGFKFKEVDLNSSDPVPATEDYLLRIKPDGRISGCVVKDGVVKKYVIKTLGNPNGFSSEAYLAALLVLIFNHAEVFPDDYKRFFFDKFAFIKEENLPEKDYFIMVLADNLYKLLEEKEFVETEYNVQPFPFFTSPANGEVEFEDFVSNPVSVDMKTGAECSYFHLGNGGTPIKPGPKSWKDNAGTFEINSNRSLLPFEKERLFEIPEFYEEPKDLLRYARLYHDTYGKNMNLRYFLLAGPSGTGKTEWANCFAAMINRPIVHFNCDAEMSKDDLLTRFVPADGVPGAIKHVPTELLEALQFGWVVEIAEPTLLQPAVLAAMNSLFDATGTTVTPDGRVIRIHPETVVIMTTNLRYEGCNSFNQSVLSRFTLVNIPYLASEDLEKRVMTYSGLKDKRIIKKMINVYSDAVNKSNELEIHDGAIDPRALYQWAAATAVDGEIWQNGLDMFISKCSLDESNFDVFIHCLETEFSRGETI